MSLEQEQDTAVAGVARVAAFQNAALPNALVDDQPQSLSNVVAEFRKRGGSVTFIMDVASAAGTIELPTHITDSNAVTVHAVCPSGLVLSQVMMPVFHLLDLSPAFHLQAPHGSTTGCDPYLDRFTEPESVDDVKDFVYAPFAGAHDRREAAYSLAFSGLRKASRAGEDVLLQLPHELNTDVLEDCRAVRTFMRGWMDHNYWKMYSPHNVFITFGEAAHVAMFRLLENNEKLDGVQVWALNQDESPLAQHGEAYDTAFLELFSTLYALFPTDPIEASLLPELLGGVVKAQEFALGTYAPNTAQPLIQPGEDTTASQLDDVLASMSRTAFAREFALLNDQTWPQDGDIVTSLLPEMAPLNRYRNILALEETRVLLQTCPTHDYINANWVVGPRGLKHYIVGQGPLPVTIADFLRLIFEQRVEVVVMLTGFVEQDRPKCANYLQDDGPFTVHVVDQNQPDSNWWIDRTVELRSSESDQVVIFHHLQFLDWPDHGVPETSEPVRAVVKQANAYTVTNGSPVLVHCSAGVGRSGTFCAINNVCESIVKQRTNDASVDAVINVFNTVLDLRRGRALMVQNADQYEFVYRAVADFLHEDVDDAVHASVASGGDANSEPVVTPDQGAAVDPSGGNDEECDGRGDDADAMAASGTPVEETTD